MGVFITDREDEYLLFYNLNIDVKACLARADDSGLSDPKDTLTFRSECGETPLNLLDTQSLVEKSLYVTKIDEAGSIFGAMALFIPLKLVFLCEI